MKLLKYFGMKYKLCSCDIDFRDMGCNDWI